MDGANLDNAGGREKSGVPATLIPHLREKLKFLLRKSNRPMKWLSEVIVSPHHSSPSPPSIAGYQASGRVPNYYIGSLCRAFGINEAILMESDLKKFEAAVDTASAPGSGRYWRRLLEDSSEDSQGLQLIVEHGASARRLGNLMFPQEIVHETPPPLESISADNRVRFVLSAEAYLDATSRDAKEDAACHAVLLCEDMNGWKALSPNRLDRSGFCRDGDCFFFPPPGFGALKINGPYGRFRAVLALFVQRLPKEIHDGFASGGRTPWAMDAMAAWLFDQEIARKVLIKQFIVTAP